MKEKTKEVVKTDNNTEGLSSNLIDPEVEEIVNSIIQLKKGNRKHRFHLYRMFNLPISSCARLAGYSANHGYRLVKEFENSGKTRRTVEKFLNSMPESYKGICKLQLARISQIESAALEAYENDPKLVINRPALLKQVKQGAGILSDDTPHAQFIRIDSVQNLMLQVHKNRGAAHKDEGEK